jgi:hypothetical protein
MLALLQASHGVLRPVWVRLRARWSPPELEKPAPKTLTADQIHAQNHGAGRSGGLRVGGLPVGELLSLRGAFTRDAKDPETNGRPHWSTAAGGHLFYSRSGKWYLQADGFTPGKGTADAYFETAGGVPAGDAVWRICPSTTGLNGWTDVKLTVEEADAAEVADAAEDNVRGAERPGR